MPLMIANLKVWPLVNILNFTVVPENLRVLFGNLVGVAWVSDNDCRVGDEQLLCYRASLLTTLLRGLR